jgi:hypothetical protein
MSENTPRRNPVRSIKNFVVKHERPILITTTVVSTTAAVVMRTGVAQHNAFLKEHGLYEQFYNMTPEVTA